MALRTVTLQGKYQTLAGDPAVGTVSFELSGPLLDSAGNVIYPSLKRVERLDETGSFSVVLPATKGDVSTAPQGLTYKINEAISPGLSHVYAIELDADLGTEQQLADIAPATNVTVQTYALVSTLAAHTAASENVHGIPDTSQLATLADLAGIGGASAWGDLTGTLSAQTDLATALDAKADTTAVTTSLAAKLDSATYAAFTPNVNRMPVLVVASSTASAKERALADYVCDGTADDVQINAALTALTTARQTIVSNGSNVSMPVGGTVLLSEGQFNLAAPLVMDSYTRLIGHGKATILFQANGANLDAMIRSVNFSTLTGTSAFFIASGCPVGIVIRDLQLDGNKTNQTAGAGDGVKVFARQSWMDELYIYNTRGRGLYTESGGTSTAANLGQDYPPESYFGHIVVLYAGSHAIEYAGPTDSVFRAITTGRGGGRGFYSHGQGTGNILYAHVYASANEGIYAGSPLTCNYLALDSNYGTGLVFAANDCFASFVYGWTPGVGNQPTHIIMSGNHGVIGDSYLTMTAGDGGGAYAVQIDGSQNRFSGMLDTNLPATAHIGLGASAVGNSVDATVVATKGTVLALSDGAATNQIRIAASISGTATHWNGSGSGTNDVTYRGSGNNGVSRANGKATVASGSTSVTVTHGLLRAPDAGEIQVTPTNGLGTATKFWVGSTTSTTFTINVDADPGAETATFAWWAELGAVQAPPAPTILVTDAFTGTSGTALASHTADTGQTWTDDTAGIQLNGSGAAHTANAGPTFSHLSAGISDAIFSLDINLGADTGTTTQARHAYLVYRFQDSSNYFAARLRRSADGTVHDVSILKWVAGVPSNVYFVNANVAVAASTTYTLSVVTSGNNHTLKLNGATITTVTDSDLATATGAGVRMRYESASEPTGFVVDNFSVSA